MRMCVGCREMKEKKTLLRIVKNAEGVIAFDRTGKASGRGAYICRNLACFEKARQQKQLERAFECALGEEVNASLLRELETLEAQA